MMSDLFFDLVIGALLLHKLLQYLSDHPAMCQLRDAFTDIGNTFMKKVNPTTQLSPSEIGGLIGHIAEHVLGTRLMNYGHLTIFTTKHPADECWLIRVWVDDRSFAQRIAPPMHVDTHVEACKRITDQLWKLEDTIMQELMSQGVVAT